MDRPSSRLRSIISTFSDDTATHLSIAFSKHIYPMLDTLPEAQLPPIFSAFQAAEKEVQHTRSLVAKIDFAARKQTFEAALRAAEISREVSVWLETGTRCTENVCDWLPVLWQVGVEKGLNRKLVRECLSFCEEVNRRLVPPRAVAEEWSVAVLRFLPQVSDFPHRDSLETELVVTNTSGDLAFSLGACPLSHAIAWMWLELLVSTLAESESEDQEVLDEELLDHVRSSTSFRLLQEFVEAQYDQEEGKLHSPISPAHFDNISRTRSCQRNRHQPWAGTLVAFQKAGIHEATQAALRPHHPGLPGVANLRELPDARDRRPQPTTYTPRSDTAARARQHP